MPKDKAVIWDLDNTLYIFTDEFKQKCHHAAAKAVMDVGFSGSYEECLKIAEESERQYNYSLHSFLIDHDFIYEDLHFAFHDHFDSSTLEPLEGLKERFESFDYPQVILTNGSKKWASRLTHQMGLENIFSEDKIVAMEDVNFIPKARGTDGFEKALSLMGTTAAETFIVDDLERNFIHPHAMGMTTIYLDHHQSNSDTKDYIHHKIDTVFDAFDVIENA